MNCKDPKLQEKAFSDLMLEPKPPKKCNHQPGRVKTTEVPEVPDDLMKSSDMSQSLEDLDKISDSCASPGIKKQSTNDMFKRINTVERKSAVIRRNSLVAKFASKLKRRGSDSKNNSTQPKEEDLVDDYVEDPWVEDVRKRKTMLHERRKRLEQTIRETHEKE